MDIEINEYVRTSDGIKRIIKINTGKEATYYGTYILDTKYKGSNSIARKNILNHSKNIEDLLEKGDIINQQGVVCFVEDGIVYANDYNFDDSLITYKKEQIKTILTKEQYEQYAYKVEEQ